MIYFNWKGPQGRETVDQLDRADYPATSEGYKAYRAEARRLAGEYALAGMNVYESSRCCAGWKD